MLTGSDFLCSFSSPDGRRWISKNCSMDQHPAVLYHELTMTQTTSSSYEEAETINTTMGALMEPEYYPALYRTLGSILIGVILLIGVVGNALVVVVVSRTPSMHSPTNCYLVSLAVADILLLVSAALPTLVEYHLIVDQFILGSVGCSVMVFTQYLGVNLSSLSITAFTVERYIAICHPIRSQTICTVGRAKKIILFLWVFGVSYCGPWLGLARTVPLNLTDGSTIERCTFTLPRNHYLVYYLADLIIFYAVPLLTACILYGLIGVALYASTLRQSTSGGGVGGTRGVPDKGDVRASTGVSASKGVRQTERTVLVVRNSSAVGAVEAEGRSRDRQKRALGSTPEERNSPKRAKKITSSTRSLATSRVQVVKMLAVVVAMFATLWLPYRVYVVYNSFASRRFEDRWFLLFCRTAVYTNSAVNPILYNAMSAKFRLAFRRLLSCLGSSSTRTADIELATGARRSTSDDGKRHLVVITTTDHCSQRTTDLKVILNGPPTSTMTF